MSRKPPSLPDTVEGREECLRRANARIVRVLLTRPAQEPSLLKMGTTLKVWVQGPEVALRFANEGIDQADLEHLVTLIRPFTLAREAIQAEKVTEALDSFTQTREHEVYVEQLPGLLDKTRGSRLYISQWDSSTGKAVIPEWTSDRFVADRYTYSAVVHADDESSLLDEVDSGAQLWALAASAGDWLAYLSHVQGVIQAVRPDLVPQITGWAGTPWSIFERHNIPFTRGGPPPAK
ncbi:hypothetical protein [Kytococcus sp. Marseille-QA3725]